MVRPPCCDKLNVKKGIWTAEEDAKILAYVSKHGTGNWTSVPKRAGLRRCGKSCRLRWTNYLRPDLRHESFTPEEEELIIRLHATIGSRWSIIAQQLPGRTDNDVKNYWNTKLKKKLSEMGIDHVTHKPFSQILADYGNMGSFQKSGSLKSDLKNTTSWSQKFEHYQPGHGGFSSINSHFLKTTTLSPEDSFFNNSGNNSMELLAQLQALKLVTEASNYTNNESITPHYINEGSLSSSPSSSSSTCSTAAQTGFSWRDFLLDDAFLPNDLQEPGNMADCSSSDSTSHTQSLISQNQFFNEATGKENTGVIRGTDFAVQDSSFQTSSSSHSPFVDAMIEQENHMFSEFLDLLAQPLKY